MENWNSAFAELPEGTKWFRLLCADDSMSSECIEKMMGVALSHSDIGVVGCKVDNNGELDEVA
ncbi:MAG: hypothetical protein R3C04_11010 [Hyphomonas sp.]